MGMNHLNTKINPGDTESVMCDVIKIRLDPSLFRGFLSFFSSHPSFLEVFFYDITHDTFCISIKPLMQVANKTAQKTTPAKTFLILTLRCDDSPHW